MDKSTDHNIHVTFTWFFSGSENTYIIFGQSPKGPNNEKLKYSNYKKTFDYLKKKK